MYCTVKIFNLIITVDPWSAVNSRGILIIIMQETSRPVSISADKSRRDIFICTSVSCSVEHDVAFVMKLEESVDTTKLT